MQLEQKSISFQSELDQDKGGLKYKLTNRIVNSDNKLSSVTNQIQSWATKENLSDWYDVFGFM